jgi:hypothetical protein
MALVLAKEKVVIAYNLYKKEIDNTLKVQVIDPFNMVVVRQVYIPYLMCTKSWKEFETMIRFKFRKQYGFELPTPWSHMNRTL